MLRNTPGRIFFFAPQRIFIDAPRPTWEDAPASLSHVFQSETRLSCLLKRPKDLPWTVPVARHIGG
jgi:hypothetical protein